MARTIPAKFKRVAAAFDEAARARLCESSGSEHSGADLSELVNWFIEGDEGTAKRQEDSDSDGECFDPVARNLLKDLFGCENDDDQKTRILDEVKIACGIVGDSSSSGFKRRLMAHLRECGFDAGLCKSKWEKSSSCLAGNYEYIDVSISETRYILEVSLAGEFEIARPSSDYASLLSVFPEIFIGKSEDLRKVVKIMCAAIRKSMKSVGLMHIPPWREKVYMGAKWFGSHKRTINAFPAIKATDSGEGLHERRSVGFEARNVVSYRCADHDFASRVDQNTSGQLTAMFNRNSTL